MNVFNSTGETYLHCSKSENDLQEKTLTNSQLPSRNTVASFYIVCFLHLPDLKLSYLEFIWFHCGTIVPNYLIIKTYLKLIYIPYIILPKETICTKQCFTIGSLLSYIVQSFIRPKYCGSKLTLKPWPPSLTNHPSVSYTHTPDECIYMELKSCFLL